MVRVAEVRDHGVEGGFMSGAKRLLELEDERRRRGIDMAIRAVVIKRCEWHDDVLLHGEKEVTDAYKLGNYMRERDAVLQDLFPSSRHLTDTIKAVAEEVALDDCPRCDKLRERD